MAEDQVPQEELDEFLVLMDCALRTDCYGWCREHCVDFQQLLERYFRPGSYGAVFSLPRDEQMVVYCLFQRIHRFREDEPEGEELEVWRRLFLTLCDWEPPPPPPEEWAVFWPDKELPILPALKRAIADRLARNAPLDEPLILESPA